MRLFRRITLAVGLCLAVALGVAAAGQLLAAEVAHLAATDAAGSAGIDAQPDGLTGAAVRLEREKRHESMSSPRWTKHSRPLLAVLVAAVAISGVSLRRAREADEVPGLLTSCWFRNCGRSPPTLQLSVV